MRWPVWWEHHALMTKHTLEARLDVLQATVLALAASLPPERAEFTRRMFAAAIADMGDRLEGDAEADTAAAGVVAAVLATLDRLSDGAHVTG